VFVFFGYVLFGVIVIFFRETSGPLHLGLLLEVVRTQRLVPLLLCA